MAKLEVVPLTGIPEVERGANLAGLILDSLKRLGVVLKNGDIVVLKQKIVSKAEGRVVRLKDVVPGKAATRIAEEQSKDPRLVELILRESVRMVRMGHGVIVTETRHGFVCANSGVDRSNVRHGYATLLPVDPDASARRVRRALEAKTGRRLAVLVTDTFGRPWRKGQTDVAIGCSGIVPLRSYRGRTDKYGYGLKVTEPAIVDEIAAAAELVTEKLSGIPVAIVRGLEYRRGEGGAKSLAIEKDKDLFR